MNTKLGLIVPLLTYKTQALYNKIVQTMDYLDPDKKRAHQRRLFLGYGLFAVAIGLATMLLVYVANGWFVDTSTGEVIRNGLVFVDSKPGGARVYLNGAQQRGLTDVRLVIPGDKAYKVDIKKDGYRDWSRSFQLEGGSLRKLTYARLFPNDLQTNSAADIRSNPVNVSQSIDKRWLVLTFAENPLSMTLIDLASPNLARTELELPESIVTAGSNGTLRIEEWADDNRHFLATYTVGSNVDHLLIDRQNSSATQNLNILLGSKSYQVLLRDRKHDRYFVFDRADKLLYTATNSAGVDEQPFINRKLIQYKTFADDWAVYVTESGKDGLVQARFKRGSDDILLKELQTGDRYFTELAKLGNSPIMAVASSVEDRAIVYQNPLGYMSSHPQASLPLATTVLRAPGIRDITISSDSSIVLAYGDENMASHEFEADRSYNFDLPAKLDDGQEPRWMDGQHLTFSSGGKQYSTDFDGSNVYDLVASVARLGSFFSEDVRVMYTFTPAVAAQGNNPAVPARLNRTSLLTAADL